MLRAAHRFRHANLQMWVETPKGKNAKPVNKDRFISCVLDGQTTGACCDCRC